MSWLAAVAVVERTVDGVAGRIGGWAELAASAYGGIRTQSQGTVTATKTGGNRWLG